MGWLFRCGVGCTMFSSGIDVCLWVLYGDLSGCGC